MPEENNQNNETAKQLKPKNNGFKVKKVTEVLLSIDSDDGKTIELRLNENQIKNLKKALDQAAK
jgi:hypothetical protein